MENNLIWISLILIYSLLVINGSIFFITLLLEINKIIYKYRYRRNKDRLEPMLKKYINGEAQYEKHLIYNNNSLKTQIMITLIKKHLNKNDRRQKELFQSLGYVDGLIRKAEKNLTLELIHQLTELNSPKFFSLLLKGANKKEFEIVYQSCYALSLLSMNHKQIREYIKTLIKSDILRDRMIEMINNLSLTVEEYSVLLEAEDTVVGKVVFLRVLENKLNSKNENVQMKLVDYLIDANYSIEIRIATVVALASSGKGKIQEILMNQYEAEDAWEVRAAIAKAMHHFTNDKITKQIDVLKKMMFDQNYWVRFNAGGVLASKGYTGIDALIDISINEENLEAADLAFYILDANEFINQNINKVGGINNE